MIKLGGMMTALLQTALMLLVLSLIGYFLERCWPSVRDYRLLRRGIGTDVVYWFLTPLFIRPIVRVASLIVLIPLGLLLGRDLGPTFAAGFGPLGNQPMLLIALEMLVIGDFVSYWVHRWFHQGVPWRFHAVHHGSEQLTWLSSVRVHPLNTLINRTSQGAVLLCLGFPLTALAVYVPFLSLYALFLHANVSWRFGPLRYVIASPGFHRWHHTSQAEGQDKNFAGLFPFWDLLFGTYYLPREAPQRFGVDHNPPPAGFWGQMVYPFRRPVVD